MALGRLLQFFRAKQPFPDVSIGRECEIDKFCSIGRYTYIGHNCSITRATIGCFCSIANHVTIGPGEHDMDRVSTNLHLYDDIGFFEMTAKECVIGHDVWIGADCIIRRGVHIGNGAVVGANSFVNADVEDFAIVAGNPARLIRYRFPREIQNVISESRWWEKDLPDARATVQALDKQIEANA